MSELHRLRRIFKSWTGRYKRHRENIYQFDDPRIILSDLGLQMEPRTLEYLLSTDSLKQHFLDQLYQTEEGLHLDIVIDNIAIDPRLNPKVYEGDGKVVFTITWKGEEIIFAEMELPWNEPRKGQAGKPPEKTPPAKKDEEDGWIDVEIE